MTGPAQVTVTSKSTYRTHRVTLEIVGGQLLTHRVSGNRYQVARVTLCYEQDQTGPWQMMWARLAGHGLKRNGTPGARWLTESVWYSVIAAQPWLRGLIDAYLPTDTPAGVTS